MGKSIALDTKQRSYLSLSTLSFPNVILKYKKYIQKWMNSFTEPFLIHAKEDNSPLSLLS